jgi:hypothetical protein
MTTETRTYEGLSGTQAFDGYAGLRIGQRYTGVPQEDGTVLVALVGAMVGSGVKVSSEGSGLRNKFLFINLHMPDQEQPQLPALYQYTSLDGLLAIAKTKTLRLSHVLYQNDSSEYYHGLNLIKEVAAEISPSHIAIGVADELINNMSWIDVFTASFTTEPDLLSQWRGYCPNGGCSYSLFDEVLSGTLHDSLTLSKCIY